MEICKITSLAMGFSGIGLIVLCWVTRCVCYIEGLNRKESPWMLYMAIGVTQTIFLIAFVCNIISNFIVTA